MKHTASPSALAASSSQPDSFVRDRLPPAGQWPQLEYRLPELVIPDEVNLVAWLFQNAHAQGHAGRPFLRSDRVTLTYSDAFERVKRLSRRLTGEWGLIPGNRVLLRGSNSIDLALAWLGVVHAGLVAVATMPMLRAKELGEIIDKAQPALSFCEPGLLTELEAAQQTRPASGRVQLFGSLDELSAPADEPAMDSGTDRSPPCADDIAMLAFTSGTTGKPKAVVHTHRDILAACEAWPRHVLKATQDDIVMGSPPLAFTFGLGGLLVFPMRAGASVYFPPSAYTPENMVQRARDVGATIVYTAPTFYRQMAPFASQVPLPRLKQCVSAGESLPDATRQLWKTACGIDLVDGIGATEMFHIFISSSGPAIRRGAIGQVVPGYRARVVDDAGQEVPHGTLGRLAVIGPTGCRYLDDARQAQYVRDHWNYPGDTFTEDADGYFYFHARADDLIVTSGYNVAGPEVEEALLTHPAVLECAVIGVADAARGQIVQAFVVLREPAAAGSAMVEALQAHVKATLAPFKYPRRIEFIGALPRTETGKLQRFKLRQL